MSRLTNNRYDKIAALIPAYNAQESVAQVVDKTLATLLTVVVIDDGSDDETGLVAKGAGALVLVHPRNMGKGCALTTGFSYILENHPQVSAIITLDADGQHDPAYITEFVRIHQENPSQLIIGSRIRGSERIPLVRRISNAVGILFISLAAGCWIKDTQSGYRLYPTRILRKINIPPGRYETETHLIFEFLRQGSKISYVPIKAIYGSTDTPSYFKPISDFARIAKVVLKSIF